MLLVSGDVGDLLLEAFLTMLMFKLMLNVLDGAVVLQQLLLPLLSLEPSFVLSPLLLLQVIAGDHCTLQLMVISTNLRNWWKLSF